MIELGTFVVEERTLVLDQLERLGQGGKTPIEGKERVKALLK